MTTRRGFMLGMAAAPVVAAFPAFRPIPPIAPLCATPLELWPVKAMLAGMVLMSTGDGQAMWVQPTSDGRVSVPTDMVGKKLTISYNYKSKD